MSPSNLKLKSLSVLKWSASDMLGQIAKAGQRGDTAEAARLQGWLEALRKEIARRAK